jgi:hypothetical protein
MATQTWRVNKASAAAKTPLCIQDLQPCRCLLGKHQTKDLLVAQVTQHLHGLRIVRLSVG